MKNYVLDTNIILHYPEAMCNGFADNRVIITGTTLQELDAKKDLPGEIGYNARCAGRLLNDLMSKGDLTQGVPLDCGGVLMIERNGIDQSLLPVGFSIDRADNRIISSCLYMNKKSPDNPVILVSNDTLLRINASACGIEAQEYINDHMQDTGYMGHSDKYVPDEMIDEVYTRGSMQAEKNKFLPNEFVTLHSEIGSKSVLTVYRNYRLERINPITLFDWVKPKNAMQSYAMYALTAPPEEIPLVILKGPAGTAKTFLSLAAGLEQAYTDQEAMKSRYYKILISRPNTETTDKGFGYLPGDIQEKMTPLLAPYFDNLEVLLRGKYGKDESMTQIQMQMEDMFAAGVLEVCPLSFIRGRSLMHSFIICDEAQNAPRQLIKDVITRAGLGTKVVICGDPSQIDNPLLDRRNNGLVYAIETMKESLYSAVIEFSDAQNIRSLLSADAVKRMKG